MTTAQVNPSAIATNTTRDRAEHGRRAVIPTPTARSGGRRGIRRRGRWAAACPSARPARPSCTPSQRRAPPARRRGEHRTAATGPATARRPRRARASRPTASPARGRNGSFEDAYEPIPANTSREPSTTGIRVSWVAEKQHEALHHADLDEHERHAYQGEEGGRRPPSAVRSPRRLNSASGPRINTADSTPPRPACCRAR